MVEPPITNLPNRYPLGSHTRANHIVDAVGEVTTAFQGVIDSATRKMQGYTQLIRVPNKDSWSIELSNDIDRLSQGVGNRIKGKHYF